MIKRVNKQRPPQMEADGKVGLKVHLYSSSIAALVKSGMAPWRALLLVLLSTNRTAAECCRAKTVGGIEYVLQEQVSSSQLESFGCLDGCIYQVSKHNYSLTSSSEEK